jgi:DNA-binding transcriptional ArsR family regulator
MEETRRRILEFLYERYPDPVPEETLQQHTGLSSDSLERHAHYLKEKGLVGLEPYLVRITATGIGYLGKQVMDRGTTKKILERLDESYPKYVENQVFERLLNIGRDQLRRPFTYMEEIGLVEVEWSLGGYFRAKATAHGIDQLENL